MSNHDIESRTIEKGTGSDTSGRHDLTSEKATAYDQTSSGETSPTIPDDLEHYPEGGVEAWLVVLGSWAAMTASMVRKARIQIEQVKSHQMAFSTVVVYIPLIVSS